MIFLTNLLLYSYFPVIKEYKDRYWFHNKSHKQNLFLKFFEILPLMMLKWKSLSIITDFYKSILTIMLTRPIFFNDVKIANNYSKSWLVTAVFLLSIQYLLSHFGTSWSLNLWLLTWYFCVVYWVIWERNTLLKGPLT